MLNHWDIKETEKISKRKKKKKKTVSMTVCFRLQTSKTLKYVGFCFVLFLIALQSLCQLHPLFTSAKVEAQSLSGLGQEKHSLFQIQNALNLALGLSVWGMRRSFATHPWPGIPIKLTAFALGFPGGSDGKASVYNAGDLGSSPGLGRSPGEGNGNPLQDYCLENPMDRGAW